MDPLVFPVPSRSRTRAVAGPPRAGRGRPLPRGVAPFVAVLLALLGGIFGGPAVASAAQATLNVTVEGSGRVTGTSIDCPGDCSDGEVWRDDAPAPQRTLTATPDRGSGSSGTVAG